MSEPIPPAEFLSYIRRLSSGELDFDDAPPAVVEQITTMMKRPVDELRAEVAVRREREMQSPRPGTTAPDFELELLSPQGQRTGEMCRLSDHRGRPVALIFGSFT